ncbi:sigma-54-dependent transcriptional regulator [Bowmanella dokdonensis]|uniref:Sigma-54-dependent Fis family transcriptional regulator n=1 Tax=Bowmanella dokdonensis TaxID=751969 RepID=A0A939DJQ8_9ALTE|nr:sigma-54 dependent transcriptional regulator [Bowmanella dokdonensis]MBN7823748.1 sigma-54-dependent Fis family transcriptional regulator [Bowmanella dokdonensis]
MSATPLVLLVDDKPDNLDVLVNYLSDYGLELMVATDGEQGLELALEHTPDLVLLDVMMPGMDGYQVCRRLRQMQQTSDCPIIFMSALNDTDSKVKGFEAGAVDFISKPFQRQEVFARIQAHLTIHRQRQELRLKNLQLEQLNLELQEQMDKRQRAENELQLADERLSTLTRQEAEHWGIDAFIGRSPVITRLLEEVRSLQQAPDTNVLVLGESGTGKELISRAIHYGSRRKEKPFVAVNCSAIPAELADAEFFGHVRGAFTGASGDRSGYFVQADGGTLFLDEIGDMPLALQTKLLRVLEDGLVTPIGGRKGRLVNVRVVAATNANLRNKIRDQTFRQDLFFRLAGYQIQLPPLRERLTDIPLLVEHFLTLLGQQMGRERVTLSREAMLALRQYHYPGNVRELKNLIEYALIASRGQAIGVRHLHFLEPPSGVMQSDHPAAVAPAEESPPPAISTENQEQMLMEYARTQGKVNNNRAQALLKVDHGRASYLLKKLHKEGKLIKQGQRRWAFYMPS